MASTPTITRRVVRSESFCPTRDCSPSSSSSSSTWSCSPSSFSWARWDICLYSFRIRMRRTRRTMRPARVPAREARPALRSVVLSPAPPPSPPPKMASITAGMSKSMLTVATTSSQK